MAARGAAASEVAAEENRTPQRRRGPGPVTLLLAIYLAGPLLVLVELLSPLPAALLIVAVLLAARSLAFELPPEKPPANAEARRLRWLAGGALVATALAWILLSGMGGYAYCRLDYVKHFAIFDELGRDFLPVEIVDPRSGTPEILHYYFAYYIAPVRLAALTESLWSALDLGLVVVLFYTIATVAAFGVLGRIARVPPLALLVLVIVLGTFDVAGHAAFDVESLRQYRLFGTIDIVENLEWWGAPYAPQAFTSHLYWAPQHFFAALIGLPLLLVALRAPGGAIRMLLRSAMVLSAAAFWSPYVAAGLAAVGTADHLLRRPSGSSVPLSLGGWRRDFVADWRLALAAALFACFTALFFMASRALDPPRLLLAEVPLGDWLLTFLINHTPFLVGAGIAFWAARSARGALEAWRPAARVLLLGLGIEALLLSLTHGFYNDWAIRTTLPVLLWMALPLCRLLAGELPIWPKALLFLGVGLSAASALMELALGIEGWGQCVWTDRSGFEVLARFADQYLADRGSLFYRRLVGDF